MWKNKCVFLDSVFLALTCFFHIHLFFLTFTCFSEKQMNVEETNGDSRYSLFFSTFVSSTFIFLDIHLFFPLHFKKNKLMSILLFFPHSFLFSHKWESLTCRTVGTEKRLPLWLYLPTYLTALDVGIYLLLTVLE